MDEECKNLVASYADWLKENIAVAEVDGACVIATPFLDRHNDHLVIYVERTPDGLRLSDDRYIISDLEHSGCKLDTGQRQRILETILNGHGVREEEGELFVECAPKDFPKKKHALIQAMLSVNDMFVTAKPTVGKLFLEDVKNYLDLNDVRYSPAVDFQGKSGYVHKFDFVIPKSRDYPERLIRAINKPTKDKTEAFLFTWGDIRDVRPTGAILYAFLNDSESKIPGDVIGALREYEVKAIPWTKRDQFREELVR